MSPDQPRGQRHGGSAQRHGGSAQRPAERARRSDPPRLAAYTVARAVADGAYANLELPRVLREKGIRGRDAAFATELTYGSIRLHGLYDPIIEIAAGRPVAQIDENVLDTIRLGAHQLLGMRVPPHAALAETVALARQVNGAGAAGFVNAVLRRISERDRADWVAAASAGAPEPLARLAIEHSHPLWIVKALRGALIGSGVAPGDLAAELTALLVADNTPSPVHLVARPGSATVAELVEAGAEPSERSPYGAILPGGDPGAIAAIRQGRAAVQDEGSQIVAILLAGTPLDPAVLDDPAGAAPSPTPPTERWLDLCAGPGGKAGLLAALAIERGADLVANEVNPHRAELVRATLRSLVERAGPGQIEVRTGDGREAGQQWPAGFDRVLVDAPCTGLGALRRRPEARWRRTPADLATLTALQRQLLDSAIDATRPGGVVGYSTCSPHLVETSLAVDDVLRRRTDCERIDVTSIIGDTLPAGAIGPSAVTAAGDLQLWPHRDQTDAMFLSLVRRVR